MLVLTFQADCAAWHIPAIKEAVAMLLEQWGDVRLTEVRETVPEQLRIGGTQRRS